MLNWFFFSLCVLVYLSSNTDAATYYVATNGTTRDCTAIQNINTPASSILAAIECANDSTGNIVEIRQGTYDETLDHKNSPSDWPRGTSWSNPAIIRAFPGEIVTLRPTSGGEHIIFTANHGGAYYLSFENLRFDYSDTTWFHSQVWGNMGGGVGGGNGHFTGSYATHVRFKGNTFLPTGSSHVSGELYDWWFDGNTFLGCGDTRFDHCFYIQGGNILIENNVMAETTGGGYCVQFYDSGDTPVRSITLRNNICRDSVGAGFTLRGNTFNHVHNNVFARLTEEGISVTGGTSGRSNGEEILNNRFSDLGNSAIVIGGVAGNSSSVLISDNLFSGIGGRVIYNLDPSNPPLVSYNLCSNIKFGTCDES
jgi:Right handed beta helix region